VANKEDFANKIVETLEKAKAEISKVQKDIETFVKVEIGKELEAIANHLKTMAP